MSKSNITLHGHRLLIGRVTWLTFTLLILVVFSASLPAYFGQVQTICRTDTCPSWQLTPESARAIQQLGSSLGSWATSQDFLAALIEFTSFTVAALIFIRRSDELIALVVALFLVGFVSDINNNLEALVVVQPGWILPVHIVNYLTWIAYPLVFYLFPDGRFTPRWTRWLALVSVILYAPSFFLPGSVLDVKTRFTTFGTVFFIGSWFSFIGVQIYRYRRISTPIQRQQTKWVVFGVSIALLGLGIIGSSNLATNQPRNIVELLSGALAYFLFFLVPISFGIAVLRYRLFDIDVIIRRTLVYGVLSACLALVYFGSVLALQQVFRSVTGETSPIAIVLSTLVIAALFTPLRRGLQNFIDRRFYRRKYDAAQALEAFRVAARDEVELGKLTDDLLAVASRAIQPLSISLWLKPSAGNKPEGGERIRKA